MLILNVAYLEAGARRNEGEGSDLARGMRKDFHFSIFGTVPMIPKILGTAKIVPAKAKESANTKPRSQLSFCQLNFTKISSFMTSHATLTSQCTQHKETQHKKQ